MNATLGQIEKPVDIFLVFRQKRRVACVDVLLENRVVSGPVDRQIGRDELLDKLGATSQFFKPKIDKTLRRLA